jgi:hypothetical protein
MSQKEAAGAAAGGRRTESGFVAHPVDSTADSTAASAAATARDIGTSNAFWREPPRRVVSAG